jgi:serine protease inhibitor
MKHTWQFGALALLLMSSVSGRMEQETRPEAARTEIEAAVAGNEAFALKLYAELKERDGNLFLSPYSLRTALAMTFAGARGRTAEQMGEVLALHGEGQVPHRSIAALVQELDQRNGPTGACELNIANSLWGQRGTEFVPEFLELIEDHYGAGLRRADFAGATEEARLEINRWVAAETGQRIEELIEKDDLSPLTELVLANAIHFEASWPNRFDPKNTRERPFFASVREGGELVTKEIGVPMMYQLSEFGFRRAEGVQVLELPYSGNQLSMVILLPDSRDGLPGLESRLSPAFLTELLEDLPKQELAIHLPKFEARTHVRLEDTLAAMGMPDAFDGKQADFSGMSTTTKLWIDAVVHESVVSVDEEGTDAAGATAVIMGKRGFAFHANHPFIYLIRDVKTGTILFLGRLVDPTRG